MSKAKYISKLVDASGSTTSDNISYTGTLTGSTGILNIGSGQLYKDASGNVGIGTSSPSTYGGKLSVVSSPAGTQSTIMVQNPGQGTAHLGFASSGSNLKLYNCYTTGTLAGGFGIDITSTGQLNITNANNTATGGGQIYLNGATGNRIDFNTAGIAPPAFTTRSLGTKIVIFPGIAAAAVDYALGIDGNTLWTSVPTTASQFKWYGGTTPAATLSGTGEFTPIKALRGCYGAGAIASNLAIGDLALNVNSSGNHSTAVGYNALGRNSIGNYNTAIGSSSSPNVTSASDNTAVGFGSLGSNAVTTTGSYNTAIGSTALSWVSSGTFNSSLGWGAGSNITTATENVAIGAAALSTSASGSYNVALGTGALGNATGAKNVAVGYGAGGSISTGINNVIIGGYDGIAAPISYTGSNNIVLSDGAGTVRMYYTNASSLWTVANDFAVTGKTYLSQPAPSTTTGSNTVPVTLTIAQLLTYIIVATPITGTTVYNLPTGTLVDAGTSMDVNYSFDWYIMNNGAVSITLTAAATHPITSVGGGGTTITTGTVAHLRTRKTAANTFITYRL